MTPRTSSIWWRADSSCVRRNSPLAPRRRRLEASNWTSERELGPVATRSSVNRGALITPATHSPESPRRTETSPLIKLMRATPRLRSSGSCARAGVKLPAKESIAPVKAKNRKLPKRLIPESPELRSPFMHGGGQTNILLDLDAYGGNSQCAGGRKPPPLAAMEQVGRRKRQAPPYCAREIGRAS